MENQDQKKNQNTDRQAAENEGVRTELGAGKQQGSDNDPSDNPGKPMPDADKLTDPTTGKIRKPEEEL
ncbi:MAG: hypothetical protein EOP49_34880 [Sphingobacteriales bacterium]|nr:MAG: hypothetical protein EOP49_34880 [Sphingobacteriales bacterium]